MIRVAKVGFLEWNVEKKNAIMQEITRDHRRLLDIILWGLI